MKSYSGLTVDRVGKIAVTRLSAVAGLLAAFAVPVSTCARAEQASHGADVVVDVLAKGGDTGGHGSDAGAEPPQAEHAGAPQDTVSDEEAHSADAKAEGAHEDDGHAGADEAQEDDPAFARRQEAIDDYIREITPNAGPSGEKVKGLQPYQLIRSLQFVQDSVVQGDHSAMEMQRYLLGVIDERLRKSDQSVFDNPRNVDAALVYAMSGGNPDTLDLLANRDRFGHFDNEITTVLRAYLDGAAVRTQTSLEDILKIYGNTRIGPYLALIGANVKAGLNEDGALEMFDMARLGAPGTIIEEAALRRSLYVATQKGKIDKAIQYAIHYARRFIDSPYAGQYADQLVELGTENIAELGTERLQQILAFMDAPRQREVYLRISRKAAIAGKTELALLAAEEAKKLTDPSDPAPRALAGLYSSLASVPSDEVVEVDRNLDRLAEMPLSPRDAALRDAARLIAKEIVREPDPNSLTQAFSPTMDGQSEDGTAPEAGAATTPADETTAQDGSGEISAEAINAPADPSAAVDEDFRAYLKGQNELIDEIDGLLAGNDGVAQP